MEYPEDCAVPRDEIDDFIHILRKLGNGFFCGDHEISIFVKDEYGERETVGG